MGIGSFIHHLVAPVEHHLGPIPTAVLFPSIPLTQISATLADKIVGGVAAAGSANPGAKSNQTQTHFSDPSYQAPSVTYGAPNYPAPSYAGGGGSFDAFNYQPAYNPYGGASWDSSTTSFQPSIVPYPTYSAAAPQPADRSWEDLVATALPFFL
jgi:hypothetical protein